MSKFNVILCGPGRRSKHTVESWDRRGALIAAIGDRGHTAQLTGAGIASSGYEYFGRAIKMYAVVADVRS